VDPVEGKGIHAFLDERCGKDESVEVMGHAKAGGQWRGEGFFAFIYWKGRKIFVLDKVMSQTLGGRAILSSKSIERNTGCR